VLPRFEQIMQLATPQPAARIQIEEIAALVPIERRAQILERVI
jgi:hypothetical protein